MKLQITTDYAIRIVLYMAQQGRQLSTARETAERLGISYGYFNKVAAKIRENGFIESIQGPQGGYRMAKGAHEITLYDIIEVMEGSVRLNRCLEDDGYCSMHGSDSHVCPVHNSLAQIQQSVIGSMRGITMQDLIGEQNGQMAKTREGKNE